jgi:hypothetical protein
MLNIVVSSGIWGDNSSNPSVSTMGSPSSIETPASRVNPSISIPLSGGANPYIGIPYNQRTIRSIFILFSRSVSGEYSPL